MCEDKVIYTEPCFEHGDFDNEEVLRRNWIKRQTCYKEVVVPQLTPAITGDRSKGKGSLMRQRFMRLLKINSNKPFETEEEEYNAIGKFGRGYWSMEHITAFNKEEQEIILKVVAVAYGAFEY